MLKLVRVRGRSMSPVLEDGDLVLLRKLGTASARRLTVGDIACFRHPDLGLIIKRVAAIDTATSRFRLASENVLGSEGDAIGELPASALVGRALWRLTPMPQPMRSGSGH